MAHELLVFLHGLGQTPQAWQAQVGRLPADLQATAPWLRGLRPGSQEGFSLADAAAEVSSVLTQHGADRAYLCGISLGAMVALHAAFDDERVAGLFLASPQVRPPRWYLQAQRLMFRAVPESRLLAQGVDKRKLLGVLDSLTDTDYTGRLAELAAPTMVLCGRTDRAHRQAARKIAERAPLGRLEMIAGEGDLNTAEPELFNDRLYAFLDELRDRS